MCNRFSEPSFDDIVGVARQLAARLGVSLSEASVAVAREQAAPRAVQESLFDLAEGGSGDSEGAPRQADAMPLRQAGASAEGGRPCGLPSRVGQDAQAGRLQDVALVASSSDTARGRAAKGDRRPGSMLTVVRLSDGSLGVARLKWGYDVSWSDRPVYNARLERLSGPDPGMWGDDFKARRCVVCASRFFERNTEGALEGQGSARHRPSRFSFARPDGAPLLIACVWRGGSLSMVTRTADGVVAPVHDRMPWLMGLPEAAAWLSGQKV